MGTGTRGDLSPYTIFESSRWWRRRRVTTTTKHRASDEQLHCHNSYECVLPEYLYDDCLIAAFDPDIDHEVDSRD